jgi:DNA-binding MarR family transcriptional regulator
LPETTEIYDRSPEVIEREAATARISHLYDELMHRSATIHLRDFVDVPVTMTQAKVLFLLQAAGPLHLTELAGRLGISAPTASQVVERLVEQGLVERTEERADRRHVRVSTTARGQGQLDRFRELGSRQLRETLAHIAATDLALIERAIEILIDGLAAAGRDPVPSQPRP